MFETVARSHRRRGTRSEEHTSELQSRLHLVCRLLLEKKKQARNRAARSIRKGSSPNDSSGDSGVSNRCAAKSSTPPKGSNRCKSVYEKAIALTVNSRR